MIHLDDRKPTSNLKKKEKKDPGLASFEDSWSFHMANDAKIKKWLPNKD